MDSYSSFGKWLRQRRKSLDLTQDELAWKVGCATSMLQKVEAGERRPSHPMAESLAEALDIAPDQLAAFVQFARSGRHATVGMPFHSPGNLPAQSTPLIGREPDVKAVCQRLMQEDTRLLTLIGPPGIGKTRLSIQVSAELRDLFDDGAFFVDLSSITDPDLVAPIIIQALSIKEGGHSPPLARLSDYLQFKSLLLILDNFEQVIAAAPVVAKILTTCQLLKILATSRVALRIRAERQFPVPPLAVPDLRYPMNIEKLAQYPAVTLFIERAQAVEPSFSLTPVNAPTIARICHRLDGLPLAIELIAARVRMLPPEEIYLKLGGKFLLHSDGLRDIDERQRTLKNALDWSYRLLTEEERLFFGKLAIFTGGWTLEAAEVVCQPVDGVENGEEYSLKILSYLTSLVNQSLVIRTKDDSEARFTMLETIREYVLEKLALSEEVSVVRRRHSSYYLTLIEGAEPRFFSSAQLLRRIELEQDNLRAALKRSIEEGEIETAARLGIALATFWSAHNRHLGEWRIWLGQILEAARYHPLPASIRIKILYTTGILAYLQGDYGTARTFHMEALAQARQLKDDKLIAYTLHGLSNVAMNEGDYHIVETLLEECLPIARTTGDKWLIAMALNNQGEVERLRGNLHKASAMFKEGAELLSEIGNKGFLAILLDGLGTIAQYQGNYDEALSIHKQSLVMAQEMDDRRIIALALEKLAGVANGKGNFKKAGRLLGAAEALREAIAAPVEIVDRSDYEKFMTDTRIGLDEKSFNTTWAEGRAMSMQEAIVYALT